MQVHTIFIDFVWEVNYTSPVDVAKYAATHN